MLRLRDLVDLVHLFQLHAEGLASEFPALRTARRRGNLPVAASSFVDRLRELAVVSCGALEAGTGPARSSLAVIRRGDA